jgi:putative flippase GtrA
MNKFLKFLLSGGINTFITYIIYLALLNYMSYGISYSISFCVGIVVSYGLNRFFVFHSKGDKKTILLFPFVYVIQYIVGFILVFLWVELLQWHVFLAPIAATIITIPLTFILTKWIFKG